MSPKNPAAVALGRRGGKARVQNQTPEQRTDSARVAAEARWSKQREEIKTLKDDAEKLLVRARAKAKKGEK